MGTKGIVGELRTFDEYKQQQAAWVEETQGIFRHLDEIL